MLDSFEREIKKSPLGRGRYKYRGATPVAVFTATWLFFLVMSLLFSKLTLSLVAYAVIVA
jgi:hypothetical protein